MKKLAIMLGLGLLLVNVSSVSAAGSPPPRGIYLQVEERGEAWVIVLSKGERFYMKNGEAAYAALHSFGVGISNADLEKIPVGVLPLAGETDTDGDAIFDKLEEALGMNKNSQDTDGDSYPDWTELTYEFNPIGPGGRETKDYMLANGLKGHILLQVEGRGQAWYVNPADGKRYYMADGEGAYRVMSQLGVGITNADLAKIPILSESLNCGESVPCLMSAIEADIPAHGTVTYAWWSDDVKYENTQYVEHRLPGNYGVYTAFTRVESAKVNGVTDQASVGTTMTCTYANTADMLDQISRWLQGFTSQDDLSFATCDAEWPPATWPEWPPEVSGEIPDDTFGIEGLRS